LRRGLLFVPAKETAKGDRNEEGKESTRPAGQSPTKGHSATLARKIAEGARSSGASVMTAFLHGLLRLPETEEQGLRDRR
jgi:hypothetical protein